MRCEFKRDLEIYLQTADVPYKTLATILQHYAAEPERHPYGFSCLHAAVASGSQDADYIGTMTLRRRMKAEALKVLEPLDVCVMTGPTNLMHFLGLPSLTLPICMGEDNMPRGMILYGATEEQLLATGLTIERYCEPVMPPHLN